MPDFVHFYPIAKGIAAAIVRRYLRWRWREDVDDVVGDVLVKIFRRWPMLSAWNEGQQIQYLIKTAKSTSTDFLRKMRHSPRAFAVDDEASVEVVDDKFNLGLVADWIACELKRMDDGQVNDEEIRTLIQCLGSCPIGHEEMDWAGDLVRLIEEEFQGRDVLLTILKLKFDGHQQCEIAKKLEVSSARVSQLVKTLIEMFSGRDGDDDGGAGGGGCRRRQQAVKGQVEPKRVRGRGPKGQSRALLLLILAAMRSNHNLRPVLDDVREWLGYFVQERALNKKIHEDIALADANADGGDWMTRYQIWRAGHKSFRYPENWVSSDFSDDKSPLFKKLEVIPQNEAEDRLFEKLCSDYILDTPLWGINRLLSRLRHPHIMHQNGLSVFGRILIGSSVVRLHPDAIHVIAVGETDTGAPHLVLERLSGENLDRRLWRDGPLSWLEIVELLAQVASALAALHQVGVIHHDVMPSNIATVQSATGDPFVKLIAQVASALAALHRVGVIHRDVKPNYIVTVQSITGDQWDFGSRWVGPDALLEPDWDEFQEVESGRLMRGTGADQFFDDDFIIGIYEGEDARCVLKDGSDWCFYDRQRWKESLGEGTAVIKAGGYTMPHRRVLRRGAFERVGCHDARHVQDRKLRSDPRGRVPRARFAWRSAINLTGNRSQREGDREMSTQSKKVSRESVVTVILRQCEVERVSHLGKGDALMALRRSVNADAWAVFSLAVQGVTPREISFRLRLQEHGVSALLQESWAAMRLLQDSEDCSLAENAIFLQQSCARMHAFQKSIHREEVHRARINGLESALRSALVREGPTLNN